MIEKIRLVIWDLDETFWHGTLTEGGIRIRPELCELVRTLAGRGIMSSICSKNDLAAVQPILEQEGVWDYFIFPSVNWDSKGPRIAALIEAVQLRAPTVMFIDDNPLNLQEALHFSPGLQVRSHEFIPEIAEHPGFVGKNDAALTRLAQYKLLESRKQDEQKAGSDSSAFLRTCNIRVQIDHDIMPHLDRVIELINRTNQLNFTKIRLSEDAALARAEMVKFLDSFRMQVGLVRVIDNYGDYGFCGFYAFDMMMNAMHHFCFSCRILGMGVEAWLYRRINQPRMYIKGEVLTNLREHVAVDWITPIAAGSTDQHTSQPPDDTFIYLRGGCDLTATSHYLSFKFAKVVGEYNSIRGYQNLRLDHSIFTRYAMSGMSGDQEAALASVGYTPDAVRSDLRQAIDEADAFVFSFGTDANYSLYQHKYTDAKVPFQLPHINNRNDVTKLSEEALTANLQSPEMTANYGNLSDHFSFSGPISEQEFLFTASQIVSAIGTERPIIFVKGIDYGYDRAGRYTIRHMVDFNARYELIKNLGKNVHVISIDDCIEDQAEVYDPFHYDRKVYHRLSEKIIEIVTTRHPVAKADAVMADA